MKCGRCGGVLHPISVYTTTGKVFSWSCQRCGEVVDKQILINRGLIRAENYPPEEDEFFPNPSLYPSKGEES